jgi:hypothetical protein
MKDNFLTIKNMARVLSITKMEDICRDNFSREKYKKESFIVPENS